MRQQFDPRQLEELVRLRSEAAAQAAASFDVASEMQLASAAPHDNGTAGEEVRWRGGGNVCEHIAHAVSLSSPFVPQADAEGAAAKQRRMAHDAAQAHTLIRALDAEKVPPTLALAPPFRSDRKQRAAGHLRDAPAAGCRRLCGDVGD